MIKQYDIDWGWTMNANCNHYYLSAMYLKFSLALFNKQSNNIDLNYTFRTRGSSRKYPLQPREGKDRAHSFRRSQKGH